MKRGFILLIAILIIPRFVSAEPGAGPQPGGIPSYTLNDLYVLGMERAERIKISEEDQYLAERGKDKARAALIPKVSLFGTYTRYSDSSTSSSSGSLSQPSGTATWGARIDETLSLGGREFTAYRIAKDTIEKSGYDLATVKEEYLLSISSAFYDVLKAKKAVDIARANVERLTKHRDAASVRLRVGEVTKTAVLRAEAELSGAQSDEIRAGNGLSAAKASLARIVGITGDYALKDEEGMPADAPSAGMGSALSGCSLPPVECLKQKAESGRSEIMNLSLQKKIAEDQVKFAKGSYWPTLSFEGVYSGREDDPSVLSNRDSLYAGIRLNFPIYEGGLRKAEVLEAEARLRQASLQLEDRKKAIYLEVENAYLDLLTQQGVMEKFMAQVSYSDDNYRAVSKQFDYGLANSLDVMDANTLLVTAERQLADSQYSYRLAGLRLKRTTGELMKNVLGNQ